MTGPRIIGGKLIDTEIEQQMKVIDGEIVLLERDGKWAQANALYQKCLDLAAKFNDSSHRDKTSELIRESMSLNIQLAKHGARGL
jgi:hypothetical protein